MRLWHKDLISVLPIEQLATQWKELFIIVENIQTKNTPNHILVNKVVDYPYDHLITYAQLVRNEITNKGYQTRNSAWDKIVSLKPI